MIPYSFMEVECIGNTQIIHMEETGMTQRTIGLVCTVVKSKVNISQNFVAFSEYINFTGKFVDFTKQCFAFMSQQTFPLIIWIFPKVEGDGIESGLSS